MKLLKILLLSIILSITLFSNVFATESQQDLSNNLEILSSLLTVNNDEIEDLQEDNSEISTSTIPTSSQIVTTSTSSEDGDLSISDIINIILIAGGLVLIFLAVAILLRSK